MGWTILALGVLAVTLIGWVWGDLIEKTKDIDTEEPCDFWMTDED